MQMVSMEHLRWLVDTGEKLTLADGETVDVWVLNHETDDEVLSTWASHFRNHYCLDDEIDFYRRGYNFSRAEYLKEIKFPDSSVAPGPSIRAGDFSEILVSDYLQYILNYWVPRTRYGDKTVRNESTKGSDIIGFKIISDKQDSLDDALAIFEAKAKFTGRKQNRLQDAVNDSAKDHSRIGESLNAIKQRLFDKGMLHDAERIERFQNLEDRPYTEVYGAVALLSTAIFDPNEEIKTQTSSHPNSNNLKLLIIHGDELMELVHEIYRRSADEA
ncbi:MULTISPECIES: Hachiman antiphage defense system protein HamA [unclassified Virgibacillus]|uniref:Hachiman antiphage defense system protein HamA n=1 Tax=unclassified Virgibacillus TaxID=2620237 RepID=UPI00041E90EF|nr:MULTISPECIES: Hachiman antiphage defense system protein HamA [Bacillaceae]MDY7046520.1 Hachiman antiphage defense system protein HamA [Virgibacillus sp. M23]